MNLPHPASLIDLARQRFLRARRCKRDEFIEAVRAENISSAVHYPVPLTKQPAIIYLIEPEPCPVSEDISRRIFSLPLFPDLTDQNLNDIVSGVEKVATYYMK